MGELEGIPQNPDPERDISCSVDRLVEMTVKLDLLPSALCNQVASSKFLGFLFLMA